MPLNESGPRVPPSARTQSDEYYEAVLRAEAKAADPPPTKIDTRPNLFLPNGWVRPNPDYMKEVSA